MCTASVYVGKYLLLLKIIIMLFLFVYSLREFSRFLEKAVSIVALGNSLKSDGRVSNRNYSRTSAVKKQNSSLTVNTETQTSSGRAVKLF